MDDKNKYNNALEKLQEALAPKDGREISGLTRACIEEIFPELAESEDEKIKNSIIENLKCNMYRADGDYDLLNKQIAWLESLNTKYLKKVESNPAWSNGYSNGYIQAVEKAVEWLENHNDYIDVKDGNVTYFDMEKCVKDFRKAMKGGEE